MFKLIFAGTFLFFALIFLLIGMLKGRKYKFQYSLSRLITVIISAVVAMALSALIASGLGGLLVGIVSSLLPEEVSPILEAIPSAPDAVKALVAMIVAPILFFGIFLIVKPLIGLLKRPIARLLLKIGKKKTPEAPAAAEAVAEADKAEVAEAEAAEAEAAEAGAAEETETETVEAEAIEASVEETEEEPKKEKKKHIKRKPFLSDKKFDPLGALCGALCSFVVYVVLLVPMVGTVTVANNAVALLGNAEDETTQMVCEISNAAAENFGAKTVRVLGGDLLYNGLTTYRVNGESVSLQKEMNFVGAVGKAVINISDEEVSSKDSADSLREVPDAFEKSTMIPVLLSELLSAASDDWSQGKEFCGIKAPSLGESFDPVVQDLMFIMKDSDRDTISADVRTIVNTLALFIENDALESMKSDNGVMVMLKNETLISGVMLEILENERLSPLVNSITNMGISLLAEQLGLAPSAEAMYEGFVGDMADEYQNIVAQNLGSGETVEALSKSVDDIFDNYGIAISDGVSKCIAADMMKGLSSGDISEIEKFFASASDSSNNMAIGNYYGVTYLSTAKSDSDSSKATSTLESILGRVTADTTREQLKTIIEEELARGMSGVTEGSFAALAEQMSASMYQDIKDGKLKYKATFNSADEFAKNSVKLTRDDLKMDITTVSDKAKEADSVAKMFGTVFTVVDNLEGEASIGSIVESFGPVLDAASGCEMVGSEGAANLLTAVLQSNTVRDNVGFTVTQATDIATSINENSAKEGESYTTLMKSLGNTVTVIEKTSKEGEDATESINELIKDMTPASAEVLKTLSTPETMKNYGVPEASAAPVSEMLADLFGNMAHAKEQGMSDEQYAKESAAIRDLLNLAMSAGKSDGKDIFGEDSATGVTADEYINRANESTIIKKTVVNAAYVDGGDTPKSDPLNTGKQLSDSEKAEFVSTLDAKWKEQLNKSNDAAANAEYQKVLSSIAILVNVDVVFSGNTVTAK